MSGDTARQALAAGAKTLTQQPRRALEVFRVATDTDPLMADAWLGRIAAGDTTLATLKALADSAGRVGADLRALGLTPDGLRAAFDIEYVRLPITDPTSARLAYGAALINEGHWGDADAVLVPLSAGPAVGYVRAVLASRVSRWPDVLAAVSGCDTWTESYLARAASLLEALAAANLGLFERAGAAALRAEHSLSGTDPIVCDARFCRALILRAQGDHDSARALLTDISVRWPDFGRAKEALADPTFGLTITDTATIDSRTDRWDGGTAVSRDVREETASAQRRAELLAEGRALLDAQIGLAAVKAAVQELEDELEVRVMRQEYGLPVEGATNHLLLVGPPGTGKTTTATALGMIYAGLGLVRHPDIVEVYAPDFRGEVIGASGPKTNALIEASMGKILFMDELYSLVERHQGGEPDIIGKEAVNQLLISLEKYRLDFVFMGAGYEDLVDEFLTVNPGLDQRFNDKLRFDSYSPAEIVSIGIVYGGPRATVLNAEAQRVWLEMASVIRAYRTVSGEHGIDVLHNGRFARNVIEKAERRRTSRLVAQKREGRPVTVDDLKILTAEDIAPAVKGVCASRRDLDGIGW